MTLSAILGTPVILVGTPLASPIALCTLPLTTCRLGVAPIVVTVPGAVFAARIPCVPALVGGAVGFQGVDVGSNGGCPATTFGVALRTTDTAVVTVQ